MSQQLFKFGVIECRARMPIGRGLWFAFWMISGQNWPQDGEIDIMEGVGFEARNLAAVHSGKYSNLNGQYKAGSIRVDDPNNFHTFSLEWSYDVLKFFVDDQLLFTRTNDEHTFESYPFNDRDFQIIIK